MEETMIVQEVSQMDDESKLEDEENNNMFWNLLQNELKVEIPCYVKNIMRLCHLDNPLNFGCIRDETLAELEKFARKRMMYQLMGVEVNLQDYYGPFHKMPNKFELAIGDRFLIRQLVTVVKSKSDDFWTRALNSSKCTIAASTTTTTRTPGSCRTRICSGSRHETTVLQAVRPEQQKELQLQFEQQQQQDDGTSSELELDEEDEKPEEPLDINQERRKLTDMVRCALLKEDYGEGLDSKLVAGRVKVRVTVKSSEEQGVQRDVVTGFIKCVFCPTKLMIRKQTFGARRPRWVISNYRRHIRFHMDGKLRRPASHDFAKQLAPCKPEFYLVNCDEKMLADEDHQDDQIADETTDNDEQE